MRDKQGSRDISIPLDCIVVKDYFFSNYEFALQSFQWDVALVITYQTALLVRAVDLKVKGWALHLILLELTTIWLRIYTIISFKNRLTFGTHVLRIFKLPCSAVCELLHFEYPFTLYLRNMFSYHSYASSNTYCPINLHYEITNLGREFFLFVTLSITIIQTSKISKIPSKTPWGFGRRHLFFYRRESSLFPRRAGGGVMVHPGKVSRIVSWGILIYTDGQMNGIYFF